MSELVQRAPVTGEFRAKPRTFPRWMVNFLAIVTFMYGLSLTFTLPWTVQEAVFSDNGLMTQGPFAAIWGAS